MTALGTFDVEGGQLLVNVAFKKYVCGACSTGPTAIMSGAGFLIVIGGDRVPWSQLEPRAN
jgi:hypothetical protein